MRVDPIAIAGLAGLLFVKEAGVPVPVPGDLLVLGAGVAAAADPSSALVTLAVILVAGYAGGILQFLLVRGTMRRTLLAILERLGVPRPRIDALADRLRRSGARGVAITRMTPGVRIASIAASGLAALPMASFGPGLVAGNSVFVGGHFALGFVIGVPATAFVTSAGGTVAIGIIVALALLGGIGWFVVRRRAPAAEPTTFGAWADAACPACLALALAREP
jgi:membrane protein DedA with SNARE-associated domain